MSTFVNPTIRVNITDQKYSASYDPNNNVLTVEVPKPYNSFNLNVPSFNDLCIINGVTRIPDPDLIGFPEGNPEFIDTCRWFVPSSHSIKNETEMPSDWPYTEPPIRPVCHHPKRSSGGKYDFNTTCSADQGLHSACDFYENAVDFVVVAATTSEKIRISVVKNWRSPSRTPVFFVRNGDTVEEFSSLEFALKSYDSIKAELTERGVEITDEKISKENKKYFLTVLSS